MRKLIYFLTMFVVLSSCSNDFDYVFDKTVTERKEEAKAELTSLLADSEYGWRTTVVVGEKMKLGSFYCLNFSELGENCGEVLLSNGLEEVTSEFEVVHEAGILLKFTTRNELLHWLIVPNMMFVQGFGLDQEYVFMKEEDGKLFFQGKELEFELVLERATEEDWNMDDIKADFEKMKSCMNSNFKVISITEGVTGASESNPFFVILKSPTLLKLFYEDKEEFMYRTEYLFEEKTYYDWDAAFVFTHDGVILSQPVVIAGDTIDRFVLNDKGEFEIANEGIKGKIVGSELPFFAAPGTVDTFFSKLLTINTDNERGLRIFSSNTSPALNLVLFDVWENGEEPVFDMFSLIRGFVTSEGEELGDGLVFGDFKSDDNYTFVPVEYIKVSNHEFKIRMTGGEVRSNVEGAVERVANDSDIKNLLELMCHEKGWSIVLYEAEWGGASLYEINMYSNAAPSKNVNHVFMIPQ